MESGFRHEPVMAGEVLEYLAPRPGGVYVDCTLGGAGHAAAIMERTGGRARLIGIDRDPQAIEAARRRLEAWGDRVRIVQANFRQLPAVLSELGVERVDGILMDLGVSSPQLDDDERGFSYWGERLDMRMGPDAARTAADLVNELDEDELARILREYGEERWADRIARAIVLRRRRQRIERANELVEAIKSAIPAPARRKGPHPARRTFQALRIAVNDELGALEEALGHAVGALAPAGRLVVISFHSLEDRIVKQAFALEAKGCVCPPQTPVCVCNHTRRIRILTRRPVKAGEAETGRNPRARSAKLRAAERLPA